MGTITKTTIGGHDVRFERARIATGYSNVYKPHVGTRNRLTGAQKAANLYMSSLMAKGLHQHATIAQFKSAAAGISGAKTGMMVLGSKGLTALSTKIADKKASLKVATESKSTAIKPGSPAIISQQLNKASRIPYIIGGVLVAVYMLFKKRGKK